MLFASVFELVGECTPQQFLHTLLVRSIGVIGIIKQAQMTQCVLAQNFSHQRWPGGHARACRDCLRQVRKIPTGQSIQLPVTTLLVHELAPGAGTMALLELVDVTITVDLVAGIIEQHHAQQQMRWQQVRLPIQRCGVLTGHLLQGMCQKLTDIALLPIGELTGRHRLQLFHGGTGILAGRRESSALRFRQMIDQRLQLILPQTRHQPAQARRIELIQPG